MTNQRQAAQASIVLDTAFSIHTLTFSICSDCLSQVQQETSRTSYKGIEYSIITEILTKSKTSSHEIMLKTAFHIPTSKTATETMPTTTIYYTTFPAQSFESASASTLMESSPTSVVPTAADETKLEPIILGRQRPMKVQKTDDAWTVPVSVKASKTTESAKDLVQPIVDEIRLGIHREDGKNPISLAVSGAFRVSVGHFSCLPFSNTVCFPTLFAFPDCRSHHAPHSTLY